MARSCRIEHRRTEYFLLETVHLYVSPYPGTCLFKRGHAFCSTNNTECVPCARPCAWWWAFSGVEAAKKQSVGPAPCVPLCSLGQPPATVTDRCRWHALSQGCPSESGLGFWGEGMGKYKACAFSFSSTLLFSQFCISSSSLSGPICPPSPGLGRMPNWEKP